MNQLGPYELLGVIGRGGMGTVYRARNIETGDLVAVKALAHSHHEDEHFRERFAAEIQALLKLDHPNIVRLLGYGESEGALYFAMELVDGKSLYQIQKEIRIFDWREVLVICRDVAAGLRHAHDRGIIHRDLKPGNLIKSPEGLIKITDFGIAKEFGVSHDTRDNVVGTIDYMSPEQALGRPVTARSDLYSLGVVLYTLLAGQPPFASNSIEQSLRNLTRVPAPRIRSAVPTVPEPLEDVIDQLLEKKPENRFPTAFALLRRLEHVEQVLRDGSEAATSHGQKKGTVRQTSVKPENTFRLGQPAGEKDAAGEAGKSTEGGGHTRPAPAVPGTRSGKETVVQTDVAGSGSDARGPRPDYFNPITDQQRRKIFDPVAERERSPGTHWLLVLLALILVVSMGVYGIRQAFRLPTAGELYEKIELQADRPDLMVEELRMFLMHYPDDPRADRIRQLNDVAESMRLFKRLSLLARMPGESRLTRFESEFVDLVAKAQEEPGRWLPKLSAFVTLNDAGDDTEDERRPVVSAARTWLRRISERAANDIASSRQSIESNLQRARSSPAEARDIYQGIIDYYGETEWARELVDEARAGLERLDRDGPSS